MNIHSMDHVLFNYFFLKYYVVKVTNSTFIVHLGLKMYNKTKYRKGIH